MKIYNKYYRNLREYFQELEMKEFIEIWNKFSKLSLQYKFLKIANLFERLNIKTIDVPILKFITMFIDFTRWKIYDFFLFLINGRKFNLYGVTCFCRKTRLRKDNRSYRAVRKNKKSLSRVHYLHKCELYKTRYSINKLVTIAIFEKWRQRCSFCY